MPIHVKVLSAKDYSAWVDGEMKKIAAKADDPSKVWTMDELMARGQKLFDANCAVCHKADGKGAGQFPALDGSAIVKAEDHAAQLHLVLNGKGQMPAWKGVLKDSEIAAVVTYTKNAWSNKTGQLIQPAEVVAERAK